MCWKSWNCGGRNIKNEQAVRLLILLNTVVVPVEGFLLLQKISADLQETRNSAYIARKYSV